jgi:two-component system phosphate regulon sensor histidine kinase PhoR
MSASRNLLDRVHGSISAPPPVAARAHAIKNCISVVRAVNRLLEEEVGEQGRERLERSQAAVVRMLALLESDLAPPAMLRADGGTFLRADQVFDAVVERVADRAAAEGVKLVVDCGPGGVVCDPHALIEAVLNLVVNGVEASTFGSAVVIKTRELRDGSQEWTVSDSGSGIPADRLGRLGIPFVTSREGGAGLGLAMARSVIEQHGGVTRVESQPNVGTTVSIWLPAPEGRRTAAELVALLDDMVEALKVATRQVGWVRPLVAIHAEIEHGVLPRSYVDGTMLAPSCREVLALVGGSRRTEFSERYASARSSSPRVQALHERALSLCRRVAEVHDANGCRDDPTGPLVR